ncbi:MAG: endonuclease/exonuclease/phosphatase family protein [Clostridia bacterium]|nr:endonuclease/exonuclease/phosphatase family protein [Clostridia bacterium]
MSKVIAFIMSIVTAVTGLFVNRVEIKSAEERVKDNENIVVASYNTTAPWGNTLQGTGSNKRLKLFAQQINDRLPDVLGVQELNNIWLEKLENYLPQYEYYGVLRGGDENEKKSEMNGIFYLKDKYELLESNTFWISETPEVESRFDGAGCNRTCSYIVLKNKSTGEIFAHFNTHLDNASVEAQNLGGTLIAEKTDEIISKYGNIPVVVTGDFNQYSDGEGCKALENKGFLNANTTVENGDNMLSYNGWTKETVGRPIDFIFVNSNFTVKAYTVVTETGARVNVSDHYMIEAILEIR